MKRHTKAKLLAATILILLAAGYSHFYRTHQQQIGREAFLAYQAKRYDTFLVRPSGVSEVAGAVLAFGILFTVYELLALGLAKVFSDDPPHDAPTI
jgi:hypothetical protein